MSKDSIRLSKEFGLNATLTICPQCGEKGDEIALAGDSTKYYCNNCSLNFIGETGKKRCPECNSAKHVDTIGVFNGFHERLMASQPCKKCQDLNKKQADMIAEGGIYWKCSKCGSSGAINADHPLSAEVRDKMGIPEGPCGIDFDGTDMCPICSGQMDGKSIDDFNEAV